MSRRPRDSPDFGSPAGSVSGEPRGFASPPRSGFALSAGDSWSFTVEIGTTAGDLRRVSFAWPDVRYLGVDLGARRARGLGLGPRGRLVRSGHRRTGGVVARGVRAGVDAVDHDAEDVGPRPLQLGDGLRGELAARPAPVDHQHDALRD